MLFKLRKVLRGYKVFILDRYMSFLLKRQRIEGEFVFITGADSSHFKSVKQFVESFLKFEKNSKLIFYDLGLSMDQSVEFQANFPDIIYEKFNYFKYPDFFDIKTNAGEYAWKPAIIQEILERYKCKVVWMDAGNLIIEKLDTLKKFITLKGYFWNYSPDNIEDWTHKKTLSYFNLAEKLYKCRNLSAAALGFDYNFKKARELVHEWKECAVVKECIAPEGSNRKNHRQDQSVLTILAYKKGLAGGIKLKNPGFLVQQDIDWVDDEEVEQ